MQVVLPLRYFFKNSSLQMLASDSLSFRLPCRNHSYQLSVISYHIEKIKSFFLRINFRKSFVWKPGVYNLKQSN